MVVKYRAAAALEFGQRRQDFLHQLYWSPDGVLSTRHGAQTQFVGPREAFWVQRAVSHEVRGGDWQTVYRLCLREVPPALDGLRAGAVSLDDEAGRLVQAIARPGCAEREALTARERIMSGLAASTPAYLTHHATGAGYAMTVARAMSHDPGADVTLAQWAERLHVSVKTLQRDFAREFGIPYSRWRTRLRLQAARALLETQPVGEVARRVGYASPSAFVAAFGKEYGHTPGRLHKGAARPSTR